jgi:hypothetical protein
MEGLSADDFPHLWSVAQFMDWSPGAEADRLTIEILVGGLEALAGRTDGSGCGVGHERNGGP